MIFTSGAALIVKGGEPGEPTELQGLKDRRSEDYPKRESKEPLATDISEVVQYSPQIGNINVPPTPQTTQPDTSEVIRSAGSATPAPALSSGRKVPPSLLRRWILPFTLGAIIGLIVLAGRAYYLNQRPEIDLVDGAGVLKDVRRQII